MSDLDLFKGVNLNFSPRTGDKILCETVKRLQSNLRQYDCIGRYSGEEFLVLFPGCNEVEALQNAERFRESFCQSPIDTSKGQISVTLSIGVSVQGNTKKSNFESLIRLADESLGKAKNNGGNRVEVSMAN